MPQNKSYSRLYSQPVPDHLLLRELFFLILILTLAFVYVEEVDDDFVECCFRYSSGTNARCSGQMGKELRVKLNGTLRFSSHM